MPLTDWGHLCTESYLRWLPTHHTGLEGSEVTGPGAHRGHSKPVLGLRHALWQGLEEPPTYLHELGGGRGWFPSRARGLSAAWSTQPAVALSTPPGWGGVALGNGDLGAQILVCWGTSNPVSNWCSLFGGSRAAPTAPITPLWADRPPVTHLACCLHCLLPGSREEPLSPKATLAGNLPGEGIQMLLQAYSLHEGQCSKALVCTASCLASCVLMRH